MTRTKVAIGAIPYGEARTGTVSDRRRSSAQDSLCQTELGAEKRCRCCGEFWPADEEFFYRHRNTLTAVCKACRSAPRRVSPLAPDIDTVWRALAGRNVA